MNHILTYLKKQGAPDNSLLMALNHYAWADPKEGGQFLSDLQAIIGAAIIPPFQHEKEIELTYKCLLEEAFAQPKMDLEYVMQDLLNNAYHKAKHILVGMPFLKAEAESSYGAPKAAVATRTISVENEDGTKTELKVKQKKGGKKEAAIQIFSKLFNKDDRATTRTMIIDAYMKDLEMGKAGATTYFHNIEKGIWK